MIYFKKDFIEFFKDLAANNDRDWFHSNKKRYETEVKIPFEIFIEDLIKVLHEENNAIDITPKQAIFRIHRDVRFSKDKTPYKIQVSAVVSPGGKKDKTSPGLYIQMGPEHIRIYGGVFVLDKDQLYDIRAYIINNMSAFNKAITEKDFVEKFGHILGERNKIIPKEFREAAAEQELIFNKRFYYYGEMKPEMAMNQDLLKRVMDYHLSSRLIREFLTKALTS